MVHYLKPDSHSIGHLDLSAFLEGGDDIDRLLAPQTGRRHRRRNAAKQAKKAGMLAPLLAAQGCLSLGRGEAELDSSIDEGASEASASAGAGSNETVSSGGNLTAVSDSGFMTMENDPISISTGDLLANDSSLNEGTLRVTRVFGAVNGEVELIDGEIIFTPTEGYTGLASFQYEVTDALGETVISSVELMVGDGMDHTEMGDGGDHGHGGTPHDMSHSADHMAALELVPIEDATHIAVNNGSWFDPATWADGVVPGDGARVFIPEGISVDYDGESAVSLFTVRVDGNLDFATDVNTFMEVDTFVVSSSGSLTIGTVDNPVSAGVEAVIQIADNGPIDVAWDPMLLSRGVIAQGNVEIHGAEKESFLRVSVDPMAGDTSLTLDSPPTGWEVGDRLVLTGTHLTAVPQKDENDLRDITTEDEELIITRIEGNVVYFDQPLEYDHEGARSDLKAYVANMSRNVDIRTENADDIPVHQRGHVMFMHSDNVDVRYVELFELGRTDKSVRSTDISEIENVASDSNVQGRYALHIHRAGFTNLDDPVMLVGNAVTGSPGWGIVHHDSNAIIANNAVYDVFGAAFVAETGNETGRWVENIAIKATGIEHSPKNGADVLAFDNARSGTGFWFQGRLVDALDNVAAGMPGGQGFVYMSRGLDEDLINVDPAHFSFSEAFLYRSEVPINLPSLGQFSGNEVIAVDEGLVVIKAGPQQHHDLRSVIDNFTAWEVREGIHLQYTAHYTLRDIDIVGTDQTSGGGRPLYGIQLFNNVVDVVIQDANIENTSVGIDLQKNFFAALDGVTDGEFVFIDVSFNNVDLEYENLDSRDTFLTAADLVDGRLIFNSDVDRFALAPSEFGDERLELSGLKTDSLGTVAVSPEWDPHEITRERLLNAVLEEGYWTLPDGTFVTVLDQYVADRVTGEVIKVALPVTFTSTKFIDGTSYFSNEIPTYNGVFDVDSLAPTAVDDTVTTLKGTEILIDVLANDSDPDGDRLQVDGFVDGSHGQAVDNGDGTFTYIPDPGFVGTDEFWYWVEDEHGQLSQASVQVTVEI